MKKPEEWWALSSLITEMALPSLNMMILEGNTHPCDLTYDEWVEILCDIRDGFLADKMLENGDYGLTRSQWDSFSSKFTPVDVDGNVTGEPVWDWFEGELLPEGTETWRWEAVWMGEGPEPKNDPDGVERRELEAVRVHGLKLFAEWFPFLYD